MGTGLPCVHCGLCLDTCPTYRVLGTEADSPRGRIYLMEAVEDAAQALDAETSAHLDGCLGCLACETACPSGVSFGERIEEFRPRLVHSRSTRLWRRLTASASASPRALRAGLVLAHALDALGLESARRRMPALGVLPRRRRASPSSRRTPLVRSRAQPPKRPRARVALLVGCAGDVLAPRVSRAAVEVLHRCEILVVEVAAQGCCGALALHAGRVDEARALAARNVGGFDAADVDVIVTTAAGCGAMLRDYGRLLGGEHAASSVAAKARDVCEVLMELGIAPPERPLAELVPVAYHDACHLLHAAGVTEAPRAVIAAAVGSRPIDLGENNICCGSAGSYNVDRPRMAGVLGRRKAELVAEVEPRAVAVGNVGCMLQLERALALARIDVPVRHPVELLAEAYDRSR